MHALFFFPLCTNETDSRKKKKEKDTCTEYNTRWRRFKGETGRGENTIWRAEVG